MTSTAPNRGRLAIQESALAISKGIKANPVSEPSALSSDSHANAGAFSDPTSLLSAYRQLGNSESKIKRREDVSIKNDTNPSDTLNIVSVVDYFYRLFTSPYAYPPAKPANAPTPIGAMISKSAAISITSGTTPRVTAFGNGEWSDFGQGTEATKEPFKYSNNASIEGSTNVYGAFIPESDISSNANKTGVVSAVSTPSELANAKRDGNPPYTFPEPAVAPVNVDAVSQIQSMYPDVFKATNLVRTEVASVSKFFTTATYPEPCYIVNLNAKATSNETVSANVLVNGSIDDLSLGLGGFIRNATVENAGDESIAEITTIGSAGVAAGTMHGAGSYYAAADIGSNSVYVFMIERSPEIASGAPAGSVNWCVRKLAAKIELDSSAIEGGRCMISPNACSEDCGGIVVSIGRVVPGRVLGRRDAPNFTRVMVFARDHDVRQDGRLTFEQMSAPIDIDARLTILQAGFTRMANLVGIVSASTSDYVSNMQLVLYYENVQYVPSGVGNSSSQRRWVPSQSFNINASVVHPIVPIINRPRESGETDEGFVITFAGFSYYSVSETAKYLAIVEDYTTVQDLVRNVAPGSNARSIASSSPRLNVSMGYYHFVPAPIPTPPSSFQFSASATEFSAPKYFDRQITREESDFFRSFAKHMDEVAAGGMRGGTYVPVQDGKTYKILIRDRKTTALRGIDMTGSGLLVSAQMLFRRIVQVVKDRTGVPYGAIQGAFGFDIARTFIQAPTTSKPDQKGNRGPGSGSDVPIGRGSMSPGDHFLSQFKYLLEP